MAGTGLRRSARAIRYYCVYAIGVLPCWSVLRHGGAGEDKVFKNYELLLHGNWTPSHHDYDRNDRANVVLATAAHALPECLWSVRAADAGRESH